MTPPGFLYGTRLATAVLLLAASLAISSATEIALHLSEKVVASAERKFGTGARQRLTAWMKLVAENKKKSETEKLRIVNDFFNQIPFVSDEEHWGIRDYWATPVEMLATNGGDCEDFSIAKYFTLLALGVNIDRLRITYVKAMDRNPIDQAHMVLTYYSKPDAIPLVLDNLVPEVKPATQRSDLTPVYSFNGDGLWLAKERGSGRVAGGAGQISLWKEMNARLGKEFD